MQVAREMRHFVIQLVEDFALGDGRRRIGLAGAQRSQPFCGARQRGREGPAYQNECEAGDQKGLHEGGEKGVAQGARNLTVDVTSVVEKSDSPRELTVAVKRQGENVQRNLLLRIDERKLTGGKEFAGTCILFCRAYRSAGTVPEDRCESRSDSESRANGVVHHHALQVFALAEALDGPLQDSFGGAVEQRFDAFLKFHSLNFRAIRAGAAL